MAFKFEKLLVWQKALNLTSDVHLVIAKFPKSEMFVLSAQMQRAADSVVLNIVEGSTGQTNKEFGRFLGYALRSNLEVVGCIYIARNRNLIIDSDFEFIYKKCEEILVMINSLRRSVLGGQGSKKDGKDGK